MEQPEMLCSFYGYVDKKIIDLSNTYLSAISATVLKNFNENAVLNFTRIFRWSNELFAT